MLCLFISKFANYTKIYYNLHQEVIFMEENIKNIYLLKLSPKERMYIFSIADIEEPLKYNYYILSINNGFRPSMIKANNIINELKNYQRRIIKITKDNEMYDDFINSLHKVKRLNIKKPEKKYPDTDTDYKLTFGG